MNNSRQAQLRLQFRRQPSMNINGAGYVAPMAVMVAPSRVDYSVTKGGLRLWAVLLVFVILCSSFYTLFSTMESAEVAFEIDSDENLDYDGDIDDDADEMAIHNRRTEKDTTPSREYISRSRTFEENRKAHQGIQDAPDSTDDDRLEEEELEEEEEARLADLRAKAERKNNKSLDETIENVERDDSDNIIGDIGDSNDNDIDKFDISERTADGHVKEDDKARGKQDEEQNKPKRVKVHRKRIEVVEDDEEEEERKMIEKFEKEKGEEQKEEGTDGEIQIQDSVGREKEEKTVENEEEESKNKHDAEKKSGLKSRRKIPSFSMEKPKRSECKRKKCLPEYDRHPRMSLLKQIPLSMSNRNKQHSPPAFKLTEDDEEREEWKDTDEEQESEEIDDEELDDASIRDLAAVRKEKLNDRTIYKRHAITNRDDHKYRNQLDRADYLVEKHDYHSAIAIFETVLRDNPDSPRAHFGIARANDIRSEIESDHSYLDIAINEYQEVLDIDDTPDALFNQAANRLIDRARFRGLLHRVLQAQRSLIDRYPDDLQLHNNQGLTFLMMGREDDARRIFENVLKISPTNGVAQAYFGYILKLSGDLENGVLYMRKGLRAIREVIADPRFYYHFGEALTRLGKRQEAYRVYSIGAKVGLFPSPYQRSVYNVEGLTARPWWSVEQTFCSKHLKKIERQWTVIREEAAAILNSQPYLFEPEHEELTIDGQWSAYSLYSSNSWNASNCLKTPKTCNIMRMFKDSSDCLNSEIKFSLLASGTRVWPHCGYSNYRLQAHLGLTISSEARLRVGHEVRGWKTGRFLVFDDSFEQELWFEGASANKYRLILRVDLWHPEVDPVRRVDFRSV
uniref:TPR_REGION domain-containing protein n=1 Tax=Loa loa TaxID=7209 RepID=A0A1I7VPL1_LOALO